MMRAVDRGVPTSRQVEDAARSRSRVPSEDRFDLDGLLVILSGAIYLVRQNTASREVTEQRLTGPRQWRFYKEGSTLVFPDFQRTPETHRFEITVPTVLVDVIVTAGEYANWAVFGGSDDDPLGAQHEFLAFLDAHSSTHDVGMHRRTGTAYSFGFARQRMYLDDVITHIGWIDDEADDSAGIGTLQGDTADSQELDDGGLSALRVKKARVTDARAHHAIDIAREHRLAMAGALAPHHRRIDDAIAVQDERCAKAVKAFLADSRGIGGDQGHTIWSVEGKMNPGAEIEHPFGEAIVVRFDGRVTLRSVGYRPMEGRYGTGIAHPDFQPQVELSGTSVGDYYHHHAELFRGEPAAPGCLPFFVVPNPKSPGDVWVLSLRAFVETELQRIPELVSTTTDWFVARLAQYMDDHGL